MGGQVTNMALTDAAILWMGSLLANYALFIHPDNWTKNILGGLLTIIIGYAGYSFLTTNDWWGIIIMLMGAIYLVFKIGEL